MLWLTFQVLLAETISLGIFSLPRALSNLGIVPGAIAIIVFGCLSTWTGCIYADYKTEHPEVRDMAGVGELLFAHFGPRWAVAGRRLFGVCADLVLIFIMAAHVISFDLMMHALVPFEVCQIIWMVVGTIIQFVGTLPRTMKSTSWLSAGSSLCVLIAIIMVMADVGNNNPRATSGGELRMVGIASFVPIMLALLNIVTSYTGHVAYLTMASELKEPKDFKKSLFLQMGTATALYTLVAIVVYYCVGNTVEAPALGSASPVIAKAAYGIASVTIIVGGVVNAAVLDKHIYNSWCPNLVKLKSYRAIVAWVGIVAGTWVVAWLLAELIPSFYSILALLSALFGTWFSFGIPAVMWCHLHMFGKTMTTKHKFVFILVAVVFALSTFLSIAGVYATIDDLIQASSGKPFACKHKPSSIKSS